VVRDWERWPDANIGAPTGAANNFWVLDVDTVEGHGVDGSASLRELVAKNSELPHTRMSKTPTGGLHYLFKCPPGAHIKNSASEIGPGLDVRGDGGMVLLPPSIKPGVGQYECLNYDEIAEAPEWLLKLVTKPARKPSRPKRPGSARRPMRGSASEQLEAACRELNECDEGNRNHTLNRLAFRLGRFVGGGALDEDVVRSRLTEAAEACGLEEKEIPATIESGLTAGMEAKMETGEFYAVCCNFFNANWDVEAVAAEFTNNPQRYKSMSVDRIEDVYKEWLAREGLTLEDFFSYLPKENSYINRRTSAHWPGSSVNKRLPAVPLFYDDGRPMFDGEREQETELPTRWLDRNRRVDQMTWAPGQAELIEDRLVNDGGWTERPGTTCFNLYRPPSLEGGDPTKAELWVEVVETVFPDDAEHLLDFFAHRVQRPEEKINHALVLGGAPGIGKDTLIEPLKHAVGHWNFKEASPRDLLLPYNAFAQGVVLRINEVHDLGNELDRFALYEALKVYEATPQTW
jgi:hypothetical protein